MKINTLKILKNYKKNKMNELNDKTKNKSVTSSSLSDIGVETWTLHHDFPEKTEAENARNEEQKNE